MTQFADWCEEYEKKISAHMLTQFCAEPTQLKLAQKLVTAALPGYYTKSSRVAGILTRLGKKAAAKYIAGKLSTSKSIRSGDLGEVLCNAFITEMTPFKQGIRRLRWKDHRDMSMRGEDVLGFRFDSQGSLQVVKVEVKSGASMTTATIEKAREGLCGYGGLPSPHALSFVADRLSESKTDKALVDALDEVTLIKKLKKSQVTHILFTFSGNDPWNLLEVNLTSYAAKPRAVKQRYVSLQVKEHQKFIRSVFDSAGK